MIKYNYNLTKDVFQQTIARLINQIYKLLPDREEGIDWTKPLETTIIELVGLSNLINSQYDSMLFSLICKLEGLFELRADADFMLYRRTIFEILNLLSEFEKKCMAEIDQLQG